MRGLFLVILPAWIAAGCLDASGRIELSSPEDSDLVAPFSREVTGYVSDGALELDATFEGVMELSLSGESDPPAFFADLRAGRGVRELSVEHMRFSHRPLLPAKQRINLTNAELEWYQVEEIDGQARVRYRLATETLVAWKDLETDNIGPTSLVGRTYDLVLPADPRRLYDRVGESCARERGEDDILNNFNYFYYFDGQNPDCDVETTRASLTLTRLHIPLGTYYPEYDRLTADDKITVAIFFDGALEQPAKSWDQSSYEFRLLQESLEEMGFARLEDLVPFGVRHVRTRGGIEQVVDMVGPTQWSARPDTQDAFHQAMLTHEIIVYQGHAFIGQLPLFDRPDSYPPGKYQVFFIGACWGYHYFVDQILSHKATGQDPSGWELADVVAATERPYFNNGGEEIRIFLTNLFKGAETGGIDQERRYDWKSILDKMNRRVEEWYETEGSWIDMSENEYYMIEIYGASGVTSNCYDPRHPDKCTGCSDECPEDGQTRCQDNGVSTCGDYDSDNCLEWSAVQPCQQDSSCTGGRCEPDCHDDGYEDNDTPATARPSSGDLSGLQICQDDADWYRVYAEAGDVLEVEILFAHQSGDLDLQLFGPADLETPLAVSQSTSDNERISVPIGSPGEHYIHVFGYASAENAYRMRLGLSEAGDDNQEGQEDPVPACQDDAYEDNDARTSAAAVSDGAYQLQLCQNDDDWYRVELRAGDRLEVAMAHSHALGDLDLEVFDEAGNRIQSSTSSGDAEEVSVEMSAGGYRYVRVYGYLGAQNAYTLSIGVVSPVAGGCEDDPFERNDDFADATGLTGLTWGPNSFPGLSLCADDQDWYEIPLYANEVLTVDLFFRHASGDVDIHLLDENQEVLASGVSTDDNEQVEYQTDRARTVYLKIYGFASAENGYDLVVSVF